MIVQFMAYRRWHQRWGTTAAEAAQTMPGDDLIPAAAFTATRAITIAAPPKDVWPWLVQVGFGRAGFYSYDLLDHRGRPSAREVLPQFQSPGLDDVAAPMTDPPDERTSFRYAVIESPHN